MTRFAVFVLLAVLTGCTRQSPTPQKKAAAPPAVVPVTKESPPSAEKPVDLSRAKITGYFVQAYEQEGKTAMLLMGVQLEELERPPSRGQASSDSNALRIFCHFNRKLDGASNLLRGQKLTVTGKNVGQPGMAILNDAEIVER